MSLDNSIEMFIGAATITMGAYSTQVLFEQNGTTVLRKTTNELRSHRKNLRRTLETSVQLQADRINVPSTRNDQTFFSLGARRHATIRISFRLIFANASAVTGRCTPHLLWFVDKSSMCDSLAPPCRSLERSVNHHRHVCPSQHTHVQGFI